MNENDKTSQSRNPEIKVPEESRVDRRRRQIFEAAVQVFADKGYHRATVEDVAREAGLGKGTLYGYVKSKKDLLMLVAVEGQALFHEEASKVIENIKDPIEKMRALFLCGLRFFGARRSVARSLVPAVMGLEEEELERIEHTKHGFVALCEQVLNEAAEAGALRPVNTKVMAELTLHCCWIWAYSQSLQRHCGNDEEKFEGMLSEIFLGGVLKQGEV